MYHVAVKRDFIARHQNKLVYGSDCSDHEGSGPKCIGAQTIAIITPSLTKAPLSRLRMMRLSAPVLQ